MSIEKTSDNEGVPITSHSDSAPTFDSKGGSQSDAKEQENNFVFQFEEISKEFVLKKVIDSSDRSLLNLYPYKPTDENIELFNLAQCGDYKKFFQRYNQIFKEARIDQFPTLKGISNTLKYEPIKSDFLQEIRKKSDLEIFVKLQLWKTGFLLFLKSEKMIPPPCINKQVNAAVMAGHAASFQAGMKSYILRWKEINPIALKEQLDDLQQHFQCRLSEYSKPKTSMSNFAGSLALNVRSKWANIGRETAPADIKKKEILEWAKDPYLDKEYTKILSYIRNEKNSLQQELFNKLGGKDDIGCHVKDEFRERKTEQNRKEELFKIWYLKNLEPTLVKTHRYEFKEKVVIPVQHVHMFGSVDLPPLPRVNEALFMSMLWANAEKFHQEFDSICKNPKYSDSYVYAIYKMVGCHFKERQSQLEKNLHLHSVTAHEIGFCQKILTKAKEAFNDAKRSKPSHSTASSPSSFHSPKKNKMKEANEISKNAVIFSGKDLRSK